MHDLKERLETLADEGTPRGAADVMRAARQSRDGTAPLGGALVPQRSSRRSVVLAFAIVVVLAAVVVSSVLIFGAADEKSRLVPVVPTPNGLQDLYDTSNIETTTSDTLYLVPDFVPEGMEPIEVNGANPSNEPTTRGGSAETNLAQLWVRLDPAGDRAVEQFIVQWGPGARAMNGLDLGQDLPPTDDPLAYSRSGAEPTTVRGHRGFYSAKEHQLSWEEPEGQMVSVYGPSLSREDMVAIADALQARDDGSFTVTQAPPEFVQVSEAKGFAGDGIHARDASYRDAAGRGFRVRVAEDSEAPPGQNLTLPPGQGAEPRIVEVRGRHAVLTSTLVSGGGSYGQQTLFLQGADRHVTWLEPGNVSVTVSSVGLSEDEILAIARGLKVVDSASWDELLVQAPGRVGVTPSSRPAKPPSFTGEKAAVADAFHLWLDARNAQDPDAAAAGIEDGDALRETFAAVQAGSASLGVLSARVDTVRLVGSDHALVQFSILANGQPRLPDQQGGAVRVNGRWVVSRATYCGVVALVGVSCPAR